MDAIDYYEGALEKLIQKVRNFQVFFVFYNLFSKIRQILHCEAFDRSLLVLPRQLCGFWYLGLLSRIKICDIYHEGKRREIILYSLGSSFGS